MPRVVSLALSQFDVLGFARPTFVQLRNAYRKASLINVDAAAMFNANDGIRNSARGAMM